MKVILLQDVAKIGRRFEVVEVPHGFAMNKLIPQQLAKEATAENVKQVQARAVKIATEHAASDAAFGEALTQLQGKTVTVAAEANENGHLFQALKSDRIVEALQAEGINLKSEQLVIMTPIKSTGEHTVRAVSGEQEGEFTVSVEAK